MQEPLPALTSLSVIECFLDAPAHFVLTLAIPLPESRSISGIAHTSFVRS